MSGQGSGGQVCNGPQCDRQARGKGRYCDTHRAQLLRGAELAPIREKPRNDLDRQEYVPVPHDTRAACKDKSELFDDITTRTQAWAAQRVCEGCPLQLACLEYARGTQNGEDPLGRARGVWGTSWFTTAGEVEMPVAGPGVVWREKSKKWRVEIDSGSSPSKGPRRRLYGGLFDDVDLANDKADELRAQLLAEPAEELQAA